MTAAVMPFQATRADGRSDAQVVYDLVASADPGTAFSFEELEERLSEGLPQPVERNRVYRAVRQGNRLLLRRAQRALGNVRGNGYRVLFAREHLPAAQRHQERAVTHLAHGIEMLKGVDLAQLDPVQRQIHEGYLHIHVGQYEALRYTNKRLSRQEKALDEVRNAAKEMDRRLSQLEQGQPAAT